MSQRDPVREAVDEGHSSDRSVEAEDSRWSLDYGVPTDVFLARLHLQPGEHAPTWFIECPYCGGSRCEDCDFSGRIHPKRAAWFEDGLLEAQVDFALFFEVYRREEVDVPRMHVAIVTLGPMMGHFLEEWKLEDPRLSEVLEAIEETWIVPSD